MANTTTIQPDLTRELRAEAEARRTRDPALAMLLLGAALALEAAVRRVSELAPATVCPRQHMSQATEQRVREVEGPCRCASCLACRERSADARVWQ